MSSIKTIISQTIGGKEYDLASLLETIDYYHIQGSLTAEEREELTDQARENAKVQYKEEDITSILLKLNELETRVKALEDGEEGGESTSEEYPQYVPGKWYYNGSKASFEGKRYTCIAPQGVVCVWSPAEYPTYWEEVA